MAYVLCSECGLRTSGKGGEDCPRCGASLGGLPSPATPSAPTDEVPAGPIERVLALAREELGMDAAVLSEVRAEHEVVLWAAGNGRLAGAAAGTAVALADTICRRLLDGTIDNTVPDVAGNPLLRDLPTVRDGPIGAYIGVALTVESARRYVLCCLACEARPDLGDADVRFLRGLVESVRPRLDRSA